MKYNWPLNLSHAEQGKFSIALQQQWNAGGDQGLQPFILYLHWIKTEPHQDYYSNMIHSKKHISLPICPELNTPNLVSWSSRTLQHGHPEDGDSFALHNPICMSVDVCDHVWWPQSLQIIETPMFCMIIQDPDVQMWWATIRHTTSHTNDTHYHRTHFCC